jgi:alkanesulfonate monooxygenase SsuD/methylene tetrahydromethanopterin reductase-like flavin-dependent oxidoreductase (luciferase family)
MRIGGWIFVVIGVLLLVLAILLARETSRMRVVVGAINISEGTNHPLPQQNPLAFILGGSFVVLGVVLVLAGWEHEKTRKALGAATRRKKGRGRAPSQVRRRP